MATSGRDAEMKTALPNGVRCLVCRVLTRLCALPLDHVSETMRPLPVEPVAGVPRPVRGLAIIRGAPVPVVDVALALAATESNPRRFVTVHVGRRRVALAVDEVIGVRTISSHALHQLPLVLGDAGSDAVAAVGTLDTELLVVLRSARLISQQAWDVLERGGIST